jgi:uncharacterized cupredoxin-like copper-binding protein
MKSVLLVPVLAIGLIAAGCGDDSSSAAAVKVNATDSACTPERTDFSAGKLKFNVTNNGSKVTELYVYGEGDRVVSEVENIGPGTSRQLSVDLKAGDYELACKPGMTGNGIRTKIEVTGEGGSEGGAAKKATREQEVEAVDFTFEGLDGFTAKAGDTIEFYLENKGTQKHEFEVLAPDGKAVGEVEPVEPGKTGEANITFATAGTYAYQCDIEDHKAKGMAGTFTITA